MLIGGIFGFIVIEVIYAVLRAAPETWWLWAAAILLLFTVVLANLSPILIMPIFYKVVPLGEEYADLSARLIRLAERAHTKVRGVYKFDMSRRTKAANAALMGLGNTRRIVLGDTLLNEFSADEIETVLAHELGHHVNKDIPIGIVVETASTVIGLWIASLVMNWGVAVFGYTQPRRSGESAVVRAGDGPLWIDHHAAGQCLLALARKQSRRVCLAGDAQSAGLHRRDDAPGESEPRRNRSRTVGRILAALASRTGQAHQNGAMSS